jgi:excisionase family DNA binding protein
MSINRKRRKDPMEKEIMTIEEAATYLQIGKRSLYKLAKEGKRSLYKLAKEGKIPGKKVVNKWRFRKASLSEWVSQGNLR